MSRAISKSVLVILRSIIEVTEPLITSHTTSGAKSLIDAMATGTRSQRYRQRKKLKQLQLDGFIYLSGERIELTEKGIQLVRDYGRKEIIIPKTHWDGVWHLVAYDIPNNMKKERDYLRRQLIKWGFKQVQESIWVIPYGCEEEVAVESQQIRVAPYVLYMNAGQLPNEKKYLKTFNLSR